MSKLSRLAFKVRRKLFPEKTAGPSERAASTRYNRRPTYDYSSWAEYGGADHPPNPSDDRDCFIWFVPDWKNVWGGGHFTLFKFASYFTKANTRNIIFVYDNGRHWTPTDLQSDLDVAIPGNGVEVVLDARLLPSCRAAIATTWQSAYFVRSFPFATQKFYFMQDYESYFYPFGTQSI